MKKYVVLAERLSNKFGSLKAGDKFIADSKDAVVKELLKSKKIELAEPSKKDTDETNKKKGE